MSQIFTDQFVQGSRNKVKARRNVKSPLLFIYATENISESLPLICNKRSEIQLFFLIPGPIAVPKRILSLQTDEL